MAINSPVPPSGDNVNGSMGPMNHSETTETTTGSRMLREQYVPSNHELRVQPVEKSQLPSPSPTPSPRSSSPSLELSEASSTESHENGGEEHGTIASKSPETPTSDGQAENEADAEIVPSPRPVSKTVPSHQLHDIKEEGDQKPEKLSPSKDTTDEKVLKLSPSAIQELTSEPESLPLPPSAQPESRVRDRSRLRNLPSFEDLEPLQIQSPSIRAAAFSSGSQRPGYGSLSISTPSHRENWHDRTSRNISPQRRRDPSIQRSERSEGFDPNNSIKLSASNPRSRVPSFSTESVPPPPSQEVPLPPLFSTYLQLELASSRPSPLYIHRSRGQDHQFESAKIKFERLLNFLLVPVYFEPALLFGTLSCLDAWLYTFTILPLRFVKAIAILVSWWVTSLAREARFVAQFIYHGSPRLWQRQRGRVRSSDDSSAPPSRGTSECSRPPITTPRPSQKGRFSEANGTNGITGDRLITERRSKPEWTKRHRRNRSVPSTLSSYHKADILQGMVIIFSCIILMQLDASRMYHSIRGQAAMKLYVIYNVLEVGDRLLAAVGQDILECLVSDETLGRGLDGRSRLLRPLGMFILMLIYNVVHATALFYQVITLNVAVNSYSNSLFTLLLSNQFVEIKGTVFKRVEKQNLFQLFCADVVERFQLWLMLIIIGMRNIVEVGGLSIVSASQFINGAAPAFNGTVPLRASIIPNSFKIIPSWSGEVLSPFLLVLGSEIFVDWIKHCFVGKFNNVKPVIYRRFLDILAKDYYSNAFVDQNLTKRLGLPVIPLSCLFIRASVQTYHMFLASHFPPPLPSTATSIALESEATASPATTAAMEHLDTIIRKALGRATYGVGTVQRPWHSLDADDAIAFVAMAAFFLGAFLALLACKLVLGMLLLKYSRGRYEGMGRREERGAGGLDTKGRRVGGLGAVEVDEEKKAVIYEDDPEGLRMLRERERKWKEAAEKGTGGREADFEGVRRYEMAAKRIW